MFSLLSKEARLSARNGNKSAAQGRVSVMVPAGTTEPRLGIHARLTAWHVLFEIASFDVDVPPSLPGAALWDDIAIRLWPPLGQPKLWPQRRLAFADHEFERIRVTEPPPE